MNTSWQPSFPEILVASRIDGDHAGGSKTQEDPGNNAADQAKHIFLHLLVLSPLQVVVGDQVPPLKKGVTYAIIKPRPLRIAQVMMIRLSQALDSSTVLPEREKFISKRAILAVTMAAMVEMPRIWV